jgi:hypothetical protein
LYGCGERGENPYFSFRRQSGGLGDRFGRVRSWLRYGEQEVYGVLIRQPSVPGNGGGFIVPHGEVHRQGAGGCVVAGGVCQGTRRGWDEEDAPGDCSAP